MEKKNGPVKALQIVFMAMLVGQILFALLSFILLKYGLFNNGFEVKTEKIFETLAVIISLAALLLSSSVFKRKTERAREIVSLKEKFAEYRSASITKFALLESASLLNIIFYLLTGKWSFITMAIIMIFIFMTQNPIRQRIKTELQVSDTEIDEINNLQT